VTLKSASHRGSAPARARGYPSDPTREQQQSWPSCLRSILGKRHNPDRGGDHREVVPWLWRLILSTSTWRHAAGRPSRAPRRRWAFA